MTSFYYSFSNISDFPPKALRPPGSGHSGDGSLAVVSGLALRKADGDETVQWPPRRSATRNEPVLAAQSGLSGHLVLHLHRPLSGHQPAKLRPLAPPVSAVSCLRLFQTFFRQNIGCWYCRMTGCPDSGPFSGLLDYISRQFGAS